MCDGRMVEQSGQGDPAEQIAEDGRQKEPCEVVAYCRRAGEDRERRLGGPAMICEKWPSAMT